jgi:hypothetical protein
MKVRTKKIIFFCIIAWAFFTTIINLNLMNRITKLEINQVFTDENVKSSIQRLSYDVHQLRINTTQYNGENFE